jgi:hypothetical protein
MSVESLIVEYESRLNKLKNWPDKSVIYELSSFALRNTHISNHIADILISRIIDVCFNCPLVFVFSRFSLPRSSSPVFFDSRQQITLTKSLSSILLIQQ